MEPGTDNRVDLSFPTPQTRQWRPDLVSWNTTNRCNLRCDHCYLAAGPPAEAELSLEEGCELIDEMAAAGTRMLILTGGEPMMRRDIVDLAAHASSKGLLVVLGTNGMLLTPSTIQELKTAGIAGVGISLDSLRPAKHDRFRGVPGAWEGAVRGMRDCVAQDVPVLLQMTALPWNHREVADLMEFASREGATGFTLYFLVCTGRGERLSDITPAQYEEALGTLVEAQDRYPQMMVRARCAPQIGRMASRQGSALIGNAGCLAARQYCRIAPEGEVTPCPYMPLAAGNVRERSFEDLWQSSTLFERMRAETVGGRCGRCEFGSLCGGCRARALALGNDLMGEDPWCSYQPIEQSQPREDRPPAWSDEAEKRLGRIPAFIRDRVRLAVERHAQAAGKTDVTPSDLTATLEGLGRRIPFSRPRGVARPSPTSDADGPAPDSE